jgi:hypothetical protein
MSALEFQGGTAAVKEPTIDDLCVNSKDWLILALEGQTACALALGARSLDQADTALRAARRQLECAQIALNDARALERRAKRIAAKLAFFADAPEQGDADG